MRHTATCIFSHVDPDVVTNFGFLPQDMLGKSVFDFYHPEDIPFLKDAYESGNMLLKHIIRNFNLSIDFFFCSNAYVSSSRIGI